jgi:hypothetical protein
METRRIGTLDTTRGWQVAKKRVGKYLKAFQRYAVERLRHCENIFADLARLLK